MTATPPDTAAALEAAIRTFGVCAYSPSEPSSPDSLAAVHIWIEVEEHAGPLRAAITAHVEASIKAALREVPEIDAAIDAVIGAVRDDIGSDGMDAARADLDRAIAAHVEAEVARRLEAAPEVEAAIDRLDMYADPYRADALRAAIAADKARAVEALKSGMRRVFKCSTHEVDPTKAWGCPDCLVELRRARPAPDEARSIGRVAEHLRGLAAEVEPSRMADGFEADRMRLLAHRLRQVAALMPDSDEARRLVEEAIGAGMALACHGDWSDEQRAVDRAHADSARAALLRALGVEA